MLLPSPGRHMHPMLRVPGYFIKQKINIMLLCELAASWKLKILQYFIIRTKFWLLGIGNLKTLRAFPRRKLSPYGKLWLQPTTWCQNRWLYELSIHTCSFLSKNQTGLNVVYKLIGFKGFYVNSVYLLGKYFLPGRKGAGESCLLAFKELAV